MARTYQAEAIVLRTYDVGEADRFCVLLTREQGRLAARARAVRKLSSRMGGSILPFQHVDVSLTESSTGFLITGVTQRSSLPFANLQAFAAAEEAAELLLALLQDGEPMPEVFTSFHQFLSQCGEDAALARIAHTLRLLSFLGLLPSPDEFSAFAPLTSEDETFLEAVFSGEALPPIAHATRLEQLCTGLLHDHLQAPLKSRAVGNAMAL